MLLRERCCIFSNVVCYNFLYSRNRQEEKKEMKESRKFAWLIVGIMVGLTIFSYGL